MARKGYLGDDNSKAGKITKYYFSDDNGKAKRAIKVYLGDNDNLARLIHTDVGTACIHSFLFETIDPTCTEKGYTVCTCSICGAHYTKDEVAALGHTEGDPVEENRTDPTCTENGSYDTAVYCTVCGTELTRATTKVDALGHSLVRDSDYYNLNDNQHYYSATCSVCGETETVLEEHDWDRWRCDRQDCTKCHAVQLLPYSHNFNDEQWIDGYLCRVCGDCGYYERV